MACRARISRRSRWPLMPTGGCITKTSGSRRTTLRGRLQEVAKKSPEPLTLVVQADKSGQLRDGDAPHAAGARRGHFGSLAGHAARPPGSFPAMTSASVEPRPWSLRRWGGMVVLIFGVQLGLIFWLGSAHADSPAPGRARPSPFTLPAPASAELRALHDPTLFTLPHPQGFSGPVWQRMPTTGIPPLRMARADEPPSPGQLTSSAPVFNRLVETNEFDCAATPGPARGRADAPRPSSAGPVRGPIRPATGGWPGPAAPA